MHISLDGFAGGINTDAGFSHSDDELRNHSIANLAEVDCVILGRKTAVDFIPYWESVSPDAPDYTLGRTINEIPKVVFSNMLTNSEWPNTTLAKGDISEEVNNLKKQAGKEIMVYGGASFVSSLIEKGLIDEYHLFINPVALGKGLPIFNGLDKKLDLIFVNCKPFTSGKVLIVYKPKN